MKFTHCLALWLALLGAACTTLDPALPAGYRGPVATLSDSVLQDSEILGRVFCLTQVDGRPVENALLETRRASLSKGRQLSMWSKTRQLPAEQAIKLRLLGTHVMGATVDELPARAEGRFWSVEGEVTFTPERGRHYLVTGELLADGKSTVWVETADTQERVTEVVKVPPSLIPAGIPILSDLPLPTLPFGGSPAGLPGAAGR